MTVSEKEKRKHRYEVFKSFVEIEKMSDQEFGRAKEVLTRYGVPYTKNGYAKNMSQVGYIFRTPQSHYICHTKQMVELNGHSIEYKEMDRRRLNLLICQLDKWNIIRVKDREWLMSLKEGEDIGPRISLTYIQWRNSHDWNLTCRNEPSINKIVHGDPKDYIPRF